MSIVMIPMISNSPRRATLWATPVSEPKEVLAKIPMRLCESEPGNNFILQKLKNHKTSISDTEN